MSGIGFGELIILLVIGLIVLGPERLPRVANQIGNWLGQARRMTRVMKRQLEDELNIEKNFEIIPPARTKHSSQGHYAASPPGLAPAATKEEDDTFSPAHDPDSAGTGVADEPAADDAQTSPAADTAGGESGDKDKGAA